MALKLFNTLTRKKEDFRPIRAGHVSMYTCGPTIYNYAHIGNLRAYIVSDILRRYLEYRGLKVRLVMNLTDVDDKTIRGARESRQKLSDFTGKYRKAFFEDLRTLNIKSAAIYPEATKHIPDMVKLVKQLLKKGAAYRGDDGSVYFDISKFGGYGRLSRLDTKGLRSGARVCHDQYDKGNARDFALWKGWSESDGDVFWSGAELAYYLRMQMVSAARVHGKGQGIWHGESGVNAGYR